MALSLGVQLGAEAEAEDEVIAERVAKVKA